MWGGRRRSPPNRRPFPVPPRDRRRPRSPISPPPDRFRRSPPPPKRFRRDDDYDRYGARGPDPFDRRGPPYGGERFEDEPFARGPYHRPPTPPLKREPMTYKEFIGTLADDVSPDTAQREFQAYLAEYWGSQIRAEFEAKRNQDWMRKKYDILEMAKALAARNEAARAAAAEVVADVAEGRLVPTADDFNQGQGGAAADNGEPKPGIDKGGGVRDAAEADGAGGDKDTALHPEGETAPEVCWQPARIAKDAQLSKQLMAKLDAEKGIADNPLAAEDPVGVPLSPRACAAGIANCPTDGGEGDGEGVVENPPGGDVGRLDLQLTYLWRVHGLDYYAGRELAEPEAFAERGGQNRMLRGARPEEGEQAEEVEEKKQLKVMEARVDVTWKQRLAASEDPFEAKLQKGRVAEHVEAWIESQVMQIDNNKWGSKLSQKLFVGKEYVLKHIRMKHTAAIEAEQDKLYEELYWEAFKTDKEAEEARARAEAAAAQAAAWSAATPNAAPGFENYEGSGPDGYASGGPEAWPVEAGYDEAGYMEGGYGPEGVTPRGRIRAPMRGRGLRGRGPAPLGRRGSGGALLDGPMMGGPMMGAPGLGPGQMLVLAPGAGPLGPFIQVPIPEGGGRPLGGPGPGRGRGPMRGGGLMRGGGRFGGPLNGDARMMGAGPPAGLGAYRGYYDLDAPENQRSVLDYGDL